MIGFPLAGDKILFVDGNHEHVNAYPKLYDINKDPVRHPQVDELFSEYKDGSYLMSQERMH